MSGDLTGRTIAHYRVTAKLGEGGMGEVWRARDVRLGREVAIKLLAEKLGGREPNLARFEQEARAASSLNHPNIVTVHDVGSFDGRPYIVMELVEGKTVRQLLSRGRPPGMRQLLDWAAQAADAMAAAHAAGIVHRDLKPENLVVTAEGRLKILDFGLAKLTAPSTGPGVPPGSGDSTLGADESAHGAARPLSAPGALVGTLGFMAPEQVRGAPLDFRADQFAFGAILYEMVTGSPAFDRPSATETLAAILDEEPESVANLAPATPAPLRWIIERCLAKRPADRYASTLDLAHELRTLREHIDEASSSGSGSASPRPSGVRSGLWRTRPAAALTAAAAVVLAAAGISWWVLSRHVPLPPAKHLVVLGFSNSGGEEAQRVLSDGLIETLTTRLTQLERFQGSFWVVPATDVRHEGVDTVAAARRVFGATLVITGSVQRLGDEIRLTANLVDAASLRQLRALSFDARMGDVAALQDDLVRRVGRMLDLEVGPEALSVLDAGRTDVADAYDAYLQGRGHLLEFQDPAQVEGAISDFQQAIQRDPGYALAYAGLGEAYWRQYQLGHDPAVVELGRRSCARALELNSLLAPVHVTLGLLDSGTGQVERAVEDFRTALRLDPASAVARRELGNALTKLGRRDEAESTLREAIRLRPGDWANYNALGRFFYSGGQYAEAAEQFRRVIEIAPGNVRGYSNLGGIYQLLGRYAEARDALSQAVAIRPSPSALSNLGTLQFFLHDYADAARTLERAVDLGGGHDYRLWQNLAAGYYWAPGERPKAADAYRHAVELAEEALKVDPRDPLLLADLAECEAMLDRGEKARERITAALELAPDDPDVRFRAACVYEHLGARDVALKWLGEALSAGYSREQVESIPDFDSLRADPRYGALEAAHGEPREP